MEDVKFFTKKVIAFIIIFTVPILTLYYLNDKAASVMSKEYTPLITENGILITAAHLGDQDGHTLLYMDNERDVAYYLKDNYVGPKHPNQSVRIEYLEDAKIVESEEGSFEVSVSNIEMLSSGMSGTRVYSEDGKHILGFVSELLPGGLVKCISLE